MAREALEKEVATRKKLQMQLEAQSNGGCAIVNGGYHRSPKSPANERHHRSMSPNKIRHKTHVCIDV